MVSTNIIPSSSLCEETALCSLLECLVALSYNSGIYLFLNSPLNPFLCFCLLASLFLFLFSFPRGFPPPFQFCSLSIPGFPSSSSRFSSSSSAISFWPVFPLPSFFPSISSSLNPLSSPSSLINTPC